MAITLQNEGDVTSAQSISSSGLSPRLAAPLAYSGWWITGLIVWFVERDFMREKSTDNSPDFLGLTASGGLWDQVGGQDQAGVHRDRSAVCDEHRYSGRAHPGSRGL